MAIDPAVARSVVASASLRPSLAFSLSNRLLTSASYSGNALRLRTSSITAAVRALGATGPARFTQVRCKVNRAGASAYRSGDGVSGYSDLPPTEMAPLFPGCDYNHWLIVMDNPGGEGATKQQMIDCYVQTLAKVLGRY